MIKPNSKFMLVIAAAVALAALPLQAQTTKPPKKADAAQEGAAKHDKGSRPIPFHGKLASKTDASITVGSRTFQVTSETRVVKNGKPATLADGEVGQEVAGSYVEQDGKLTAKLVRFGGKPEAHKEKAKEEKK